MPAIPFLQSVEESALWKQMARYAAEDAHTAERAAVERLMGNVRTVTEAAKTLGGEVSKYMPQYTDHGERHYLNVVALMGALLRTDTLRRLHPVECALCILAAYTHDLGMTLNGEEHHAIQDPASVSPERKAYERFMDRHAEEAHHIARLRDVDTADARKAVRQIEGFLLATYLRETHTEPTPDRLRTRLREIAGAKNNDSLFTYEPPGGPPVDLLRPLALIGYSHGHPADWLRSQLEPTGDFHRSIGTARVNLAFPGLLLRLADVLDLDASRAPRVLFRHIGIETARPFHENEVSLTEWRKHAALQRPEVDVESRVPTVRFDGRPEHPVVEKAIRDFGATIEAELRAAQVEADLQRRLTGSDAYALVLPTTVDLSGVTAALGDDDRPRYLYRDVQFRLDQGEIMELLMGESLYGNPSLCIRELVQNALDALQLRTLRLADAADHAPQAHPADPIEPDRLRVEVAWGENEQGERFLRVSDNGTGMTRRIIETYFTQIGKSYYRSAEFESEKGALRSRGRLATPISHFGIGILSCFMLADRIEVRTHPGQTHRPDHEPTDVTISGPGSLFWMKEGSRTEQGTEVTLILKPDVTIEDDSRDNLIERLRHAFGYGPRTEIVAAYERAEQKRRADPTRYVDPAYTIGRYVVWPTYPIHVRPPGVPEVVVNDRFHPDVLAPLNMYAVWAKAAEWGVFAETLGTPQWHIIDWNDPETGSRMRIWTPVGAPEDPPFVDPPLSTGRARQDDLASFSESALEGTIRTEILAKGMHVPNVEHATEAFVTSAGVGTRVWLDLRGEVAPSLLASREAVRPHDHPDQWASGLTAFASRLRDHVLSFTDTGIMARNVRLGLAGTCPSMPPPPPRLPVWTALRPLTLLLQESARAGDLYRDLDCARDLSRALNRSLTLAMGVALDLARNLDLNLDLDLDWTQPFMGKPVIVTALVRDLARVRALNLVRTRDHSLNRDLVSPHVPALDHAPYRDRASLAQEQFFPSLEHSFPRLHLFHLRGQVSDGFLTAPAVPDFLTEFDERTVIKSPEGYRLQHEDWLRPNGYDLVFPLTAIPLGRLRNESPVWSDGSRAFRLGTAPFLFPEFHHVWSRHTDLLRDWLGVDSLYALLPPEYLWYTPFGEWSPGDWARCESAFWDVITGEVFWADGVVPRDEIRERGRPTPERFPEVARLRE